MTVVGIIPARMSSSRFPGKPLARICGVPMIGHVYHRSKMSRELDGVYLATCDRDIADYARQIGAPCIMTSPRHPSAVDRTAEAAHKIEKLLKKKIDIVVMIQGDEPMLRPAMIDDAVRALKKDRTVLVANLMARLKTRREHEDPNEVKVVVDQSNNALYFSREPIPSWKKGGKNVPMLKQVCIIPFRRDFLIRFNKIKRTKLEEIESIDMIRALEFGHKVRMVPTKYDTESVDTPQDLKSVEKLMRNDPLIKRYRNERS